GVSAGESWDRGECISENGRARLASEPLGSCKGLLSPPINQKESRPDRVRVGTSRRRLRTQELATGHAEPDYRCMSASLPGCVKTHVIMCFALDDSAAICGGIG